MIELGDLSSGSSEPEVDRPHPADRRQLRRAAAAVVTLLVLFGVTGSARPVTRGVPALWSIPLISTDWTMTSDAVLVNDTEVTRTLTAYDLADGARRWQRKLTDEAPWVNTEVPGVLLVQAGLITVDVIGEDGVSQAQDYLRDTVALDPATGRDRWRARGEFAGLVGTDRVLLHRWRPDGGGLREIRLVRLSDGSQVWSYTTPASGVRTTAAAGDEIVMVGLDGRVEKIRTADGVVTRGGRLPRVTPTGDPQGGSGGYDDLVVAGGTAVVVHGGANGAITVTGYDLRTLTRRWTVRSPDGRTFTCGDELICIGGRDRVTAYEPATGRPRFELTGWGYVQPAGNGLLLAGTDDGGRHALLDAATGRTVTPPSSHLMVLDPTGPAVYELHTAVAPPGTAVYRFDGRRMVLRGLIPAIGETGCRATGRYLVCDAGQQLVLRDAGLRDAG